MSSNSHNSMFPISWIICFDSWLKGLNDWLCCRSRWRACRFGWFSIFWINSRTLALCNCFTIECGSPGILKSMSSSILSRMNSLSMLCVVISRCNSGTARSAMLCLSGCPDRSQIGFGIGWVGWNNFACRETSPRGCRATSSRGCRATSSRGCRATSSCGCRSTFEPKSFVQSWRKEIFGGGRGEMCAFSYKTSPVFNLSTFGIHRLEVFLERWLHSIDFDRMLILSESQDQYQPNTPRLDVSSMRYASIVQDVVHSSQSFKDINDLCLWDQ